MSSAIKVLCRPMVNYLERLPQLSRRFYAALPKRFYKQTGILFNDGKYEITLDNRKLKTPKGAPFTVTSEPLAIAVAAEFDNQKEHIERSKMHLSALCFTALDNPNNHSKESMATYLASYITTDTVLFQYDDEKDLHEFQRREWDPIINWFNKRYETHLEKTMSISPPHISDDDTNKLFKYFLSHDVQILNGYLFAVDTLKSTILACAVIDQHISVEKAVMLSRLEEEYQLKYWERVEWAHDLSQHDLQARLAAAVLFIHLHRSERFVKEKLLT